MNIRVGIYARQSVKEDEGIKQQLSALEADMNRRGWDVAGRYADNYTSATKERGADTDWARMLKDIDAGRLDAIAVTEPTRLLRDMADFVRIRKLVRLVAIRGDVDSATTIGDFIWGQLTLIAEMEIKTKRERAIPFKEARHARGIPTPGKVPYGYRWVPGQDMERVRYAIVPDEAAAIRLMFDEALAQLGSGIALAGIARTLNAKGYRLRSGNEFDNKSVRRMLLSPYYAAMLPAISSRESRGGHAWQASKHVDLDECIPGNWEAIVTEDELRAVRAHLLDAQRLKVVTTNGGTVSRKHLLPGIARCGRTLSEVTDHGDGTGHVAVCGEPVRSAWTREGYRAYRCPVGHWTLQADVLDDWAVTTLLTRLSEPDAAQLLTPREDIDTQSLEVSRKALEQRRQNVLSLVAGGSYSLEEAQSVLEPIQAEINSLGARLAAAYESDPLAEAVSAEDVEEWWEALSLDRKRGVLAALFTPIITPAGKGNRVVSTIPKGRQVHVSQVAHPAWRRQVAGGNSVLTDAAKTAISS